MNDESDGVVAGRVADILDGAEVRWVDHEACRTSAESAAARGEDLEVGGKALVLRGGTEEVVVCVVPGPMKLDSKRLREFLGWRRCAFVGTEDLWGMFGLVPGSVPPFGAPVLPARLLCDARVFDSMRIAFNAGLLRRSVVMPSALWKQLANPEVGKFVSVLGMSSDVAAI